MILPNRTPRVNNATNDRKTKIWLLVSVRHAILSRMGVLPKTPPFLLFAPRRRVWPTSASQPIVMFRLLIGFVVCFSAVSLYAQNERSKEPEFAIEVMSVLSKSGCNAGTCHGNLNGKGGFKLSLRGQDPEFDYHSLVLASRGRRTNGAVPEKSLFLLKATGQAPHRGGIRFTSRSAEYAELMRWLKTGAKPPTPKAATVVRLDVQPSEAIVVAPIEKVQFRVTAHFSDGSSRDVTDRACYEMSNLIATAEPGGTVQRQSTGETTLIVRYLQAQRPIPIAFIEPRSDFRWSDPTPNNMIDDHVFAKLRRLKINPSDLATDVVFLRRAFLDAIGRVPTADEAKQFLYDARDDKRSRLIDSLLTRPEFADFWALKWADVLRTEEKVLDTQGVEVFHQWIRDGIASGKSLDAFARELVTGVGNTFQHAPANYYRANRDPATRGETTARLFLGTRLQCAKCHNHPFDRWTQEDYYRWAAVFSQIDYKLGENKRRDKFDKNEFVGEQTVLVSKQPEVKDPNTGRLVTPKFLGGESLDQSEAGDRLDSLGQWLTSPENELFAKSQTNFVWYHLMGRGLVDPIDDFRMTNPPSNPALMDALSERFVAGGFDLRSLVRLIMNSRTYQLSAEPNETNLHDNTGFSRASVRRLAAEVILDMQCDVLSVPAKFVGYPDDMRAVQIPGVHRKRARDQSPGPGDRFLKTFGKPERILACDCERSNETTLKQVFALIGEGLNERLESSARLRQWAESSMSHSEVIDELYWTALSRPPTDQEKSAGIELIDRSVGRANALEDIAWALLNAKEFLFRR